MPAPGRVKPPVILFMGRIFEVPWGGVRETAEALLRAAAPLCASAGRRIDVLVPKRGLCPVKHPAVREVVLRKFRGNIILWDHWTVRRHANRRRHAVLYNPKLVLPECLRIPGFTTLHDLMYFPQPAKYNWREYLLLDSLYMRLMVPRTVRRAPLTHVVSHHTAKDAAELFPGVAPKRFRAIHWGIDAEKYAPAEPTPDDTVAWSGLQARGVKGPFVFYSGGLSKRKNVSLLAQAFEMFQRRHPEFQLVLTGGSKPTMQEPEVMRLLHMIPPGRVVRLGAVTALQLRQLYQRAAMYVFPSLYEGFGLPPLEAQAAHCPVICSNATSLPEVVGNSALLFDPRSVKELREAMEAALRPEVRADLIAKGLRNVERFRWENTAREWLAMADEVAGRGL